MNNGDSRPRKAVYIKSRELPKCRCPHCKAVLDRCRGPASDQAGTIPVEGTLTICAYCSTLLAFENDGFRFGTEDELATLPESYHAMADSVLGMKIKVRCPR